MIKVSEGWAVDVEIGQTADLGERRRAVFQADCRIEVEAFADWEFGGLGEQNWLACQ